MNIPSSTSTMNNLFESWGFNIEPGMLVGDETNGRKVSLGRGPESRVTTYLFWHALNKLYISSNDVTTNQLSQIFFKTVGSIKNININKDSFEPLMVSSKQSMLYERFRIQYRVDPEELLSTFSSENEANVLAARISGIFSTGFPESSNESDNSNNINQENIHLSKSINQSNIIVVADSDFLADDTWISQQDNFGRNSITPLSDNGTFVMNALESLSGGNDLISLRSRGISNRPFEVVRKLEIEAESKYRETERSLQNELSATEKKLSDLQSYSQMDEDGSIILSSDQKDTIREFRDQIVNIRTKLRDVQHNLSRDIDELGIIIQILNVWTVPLLVGLLAVFVTFWRRHKRILHLKKLGRV